MILKENACPCAYCDYFKPIEYEKNNRIIQKGYCIKKKPLRDLYDSICKEFVLKKGIYTKKWHP